VDRLTAYMDERRKAVDAALEKYLPRLSEEPPTLHEAVRYSVFAGGKRLRPLLCLMAAAACGDEAPASGKSAEGLGKEEETALPAACALEMVHTYSLIHDDLPAMDNDDYRRGRLSCHKAFGEALAILAGDALLTLAFEIVARHARRGAVAELTRALASGAGWTGMVGGQVLDLEGEGAAAQPPKRKKAAARAAEEAAPTLRERVEAIHRRKTGALITAALHMGAISARAPREAREALRAYGQRLGLAFQIKDDILDVEAPAEVLGKTAGKDQKSGKLTYPAVLGMDEAKKLLREAVADAKRALAPFDERAAMLRLLADFVAERES